MNIKELKEIWKPIIGYENSYEISNLGNVKSLNFNRTGKPKEMKAGIESGGYKYVVLSKEGKTKNFQVHRLIAIHFIPNVNDKPHINHIDGNKLNNNLDNLEWCTRSENIQHAYDTGLAKCTKNHISRQGKYIGKFGANHVASKKVIQLSIEGSIIKIWGSLSDIERQLGIHHTSISACCRGKLKTSHGFKFKFA